jgi:hypothetical protein
MKGEQVAAEARKLQLLNIKEEMFKNSSADQQEKLKERKELTEKLEQVA